VQQPPDAGDPKTVSDSPQLLRVELEREGDLTALAKLAEGGWNLYPSIGERLFADARRDITERNPGASISSWFRQVFHGDSLSICALCGKEGGLRASHIIPSFVGKWLKSTSATGFLSQSDDLSVRVQDFPTLPLLCSYCEQKFSSLESYFASKVFYPFHNKKAREFEYDERLQLFALSLSWRTLKANLSEEFKIAAPERIPQVDQAEQDWRRMLLVGRIEKTPYENHLLFLDFATGDGVPPGFQRYVLRSVDACLVEGAGRVMTYTKLPWMVFATSIFPLKLDGWEKTILLGKGRISPRQVMMDGVFGTFLRDRAKLATKADLPKWRKEAIARAIKKDPERLLESASLDALIAEKDVERGIKMRDMPESIKALITEGIAKALDDSGKPKSENQLTKLVGRKIADSLANLSKEEADDLSGRMFATIKYSKIINGDALCRFQCNGVWVSFLVNPHSTKEYQREKIAKELEEVKKDSSRKNITPIAVFSLYVGDDGTGFEMGFWMDAQTSQDAASCELRSTLPEWRAE
jgi:hypothetical protein